MNKKMIELLELFASSKDAGEYLISSISKEWDIIGSGESLLWCYYNRKDLVSDKYKFKAVAGKRLFCVTFRIDAPALNNDSSDITHLDHAPTMELIGDPRTNDAPNIFDPSNPTDDFFYQESEIKPPRSAQFLYLDLPQGWYQSDDKEKESQVTSDFFFHFNSLSSLVPNCKSLSWQILAEIFYEKSCM